MAGVVNEHEKVDQAGEAKWCEAFRPVIEMYKDGHDFNTTSSRAKGLTAVLAWPSPYIWCCSIRDSRRARAAAAKLTSGLPATFAEAEEREILAEYSRIAVMLSSEAAHERLRDEFVSQLEGSNSASVPITSTVAMIVDAADAGHPAADHALVPAR